MSRAILLPWQERLFRILLALVVVLLLNSAALWCWTRTPDPPLTYYALLLFHFALGLVVGVPFTIYALSHQKRARSLSDNHAAAWFGASTAICGLLCMGVGVYMFGLAALGGAVTRDREWCLYLHRFTAWAMPFLYALHMRARASRLAPGRERRRLEIAATTAILVLLGTLGVGVRQVLASNAEFHLPPVDPYADKNSPFFPSEASSSTGGVLPVNLLLESQQCAQCHADIYRQWSESAHHFSSFNNPWYKASVDYMRDIDGPTATQWCAGCHDAAMLFPGIMKMKEKMRLPESHAGVACLVCHGIVEVKNTTGNG
ncbi:MAG TPA: multiheme c-type cytochrome, partial [Candidatus Xenobia bacterium]